MTGQTHSHVNDLAIFRRLVEPDSPTLNRDAAEAILRLRFGPADLKRMNDLAEKNRRGEVTDREHAELASFIRVGQTLGVLQSKARRSKGAADTSAAPA